MARNSNPAPEVKPEDKPVDMEELVEYTAPFIPGNNMPITVGCNGTIIRIQRGVPVKIKQKYLEIIQHAQEQTVSAYRTQQAAQRVHLADL